MTLTERTSLKWVAHQYPDFEMINTIYGKAQPRAAPSPMTQVVPGTPVGAFVPPSPNTPNFSSNSHITRHTLQETPYAAPSPVAQVVPGTPVGTFVPPSPNTPALRTRRSTPMVLPRNRAMSDVMGTPTRRQSSNVRLTPNISSNSHITRHTLQETPYAAPRPVAQVVPATPVGTFVPPSPNTPALRTRRSTPRVLLRNRAMSDVMGTPTRVQSSNVRLTPRRQSSNVRLTPNISSNSHITRHTLQETPYAGEINLQHRASPILQTATSRGIRLQLSPSECQLNGIKNSGKRTVSQSRSLETDVHQTTDSTPAMTMTGRTEGSGDTGASQVSSRAALQAYRRSNTDTMLPEFNLGQSSPDRLDILDGK